MPRRERIALVACEPCRTRKSRCDGITPVCSPCRTKHTQCAYSSDPNVSRFAALKSEYEQVKASLGDLSTIYERLKYGTASEASKLLERIRAEDEIPSLVEDNEPPHRSGYNQHNHNIGLVDIHQAGSHALPRGETALHQEATPEASAVPQWAGLIDPDLRVDFKEHSSFPLVPTVALQPSQTSAKMQRNPRSHISVSHKVLLWPEVVRHLRRSGLAATAGSDLQCIVEIGSPWLLQRGTTKDQTKLPRDNDATCSILRTGSVFFPNLTIQQVDEYCAAYFKTFNVLFPLLETDLFMDGIIARLSQEGYTDDDPESVLALLIIALGQLAIEGVTGYPTRVSHDESSGFRGGSTERPPGLGMFNEARRRIGMVNTQPCLETVQIMLLQATYFEASARHLDFWTSTSAASLACTCLIKSQQVEWNSSYGDLVKRAYWVCILHERLFDLEFRVASTGIESLEDLVPLPHFHGYLQGDEQPGGPLSDTSRVSPVDERIDPAFHFVAMITLSRLIGRVDEVIHDYEPNLGEAELLWQGSNINPRTDASACLPPLGRYSGPPSRLIEELCHQLALWRDALPQRLQWNDGDRFKFKKVELPAKALHTSFFSPLRNLGPGELDHNVDIAVAQLRTRFYHARFLIYRPFIYKALHSPGLMTADDRIKCAFAIDAACLWPLSLAPPKNKKHLIPHLFSWTQNFVAMVLVLRMCCKSEYLGVVCKEGGIAKDTIESTIGSMVQWLEDVKQVDGVADWCLRILGPALSS